MSHARSAFNVPSAAAAAPSQYTGSARTPASPGGGADGQRPAPQAASSSLVPQAAPALVSRAGGLLALSLQIDRLVLDGFRLDTRDQARMQTALEAELQRLLRERPFASPLGGSLPSLRLGELRLPAGADAQALGRALARALHQGIAR